LLALGSETYAESFAGPEALWTYVLQRNPSSWLAQNNLGVVDLELADAQKAPTLKRAEMDKAIAQFQAALVLNPGSVDAHTDLGFAYELTNRPQDALAQYEATLRINPHYGITQFHIAHLLESMGQIPEAISHYQEALLDNPNNNAAREALERLKNGKASGTE
jgi:tetratricopeptide (TPR) repeat protein